MQSSALSPSYVYMLQLTTFLRRRPFIDNNTVSSHLNANCRLANYKDLHISIWFIFSVQITVIQVGSRHTSEPPYFSLLAHTHEHARTHTDRTFGGARWGTKGSKRNSEPDSKNWLTCQGTAFAAVNATATVCVCVCVCVCECMFVCVCVCLCVSV
jgi:hypothetical protein